MYGRYIRPLSETGPDILRLVRHRKLILADSAQRANPIFRDISESGSRRYSIVRITHLGIVNIATYIANILLHFFYLSFLMIVFPNTWIL